MKRPSKMSKEVRLLQQLTTKNNSTSPKQLHHYRATATTVSPSSCYVSSSSSSVSSGTTDNETLSTADKTLSDSEDFGLMLGDNFEEKNDENDLDENETLQVLENEEFSDSDTEDESISIPDDDGDMSLFSDSENVLVNMKQLQNLLSKLVCHECAMTKTDKLLDVPFISKAKRIGFANVMTCTTCANKNHHDIDLCPETVEANFRMNDRRKYIINYNASLLCMKLGKGEECLSAIASSLSLFSRAGRFKHISDRVGEAILDIAEENMADNREQEVLASLTHGLEPTSMGQPLVVTSDNGWQKRSSGRAYNSPTGQNLGLGGYTKKVLYYVLLSKRCKLCEVAASKCCPVREHICPRNFSASAKSMEPAATIIMATQLYRTCPLKDGTKIYIGKHLTDDDSSTRANFQHSWKEREQKEPDFVYPRNKPAKPGYKGSKKLDYGKLPYDVPVPEERYTDRTHRIRIIKNDCYKEKKSGVFEKYHIERMGRDVGYCVHQNKDSTVAQFKTNLYAVLEHNFNNHSTCGDWCKYKKMIPTELKKFDFRFHDMSKKKGLYDLLKKKVFDKHATEAMLKQMTHDFSSQKNEMLNFLISKYAPKDMQFGSSRQLQFRVALVVCIDSTGYETFFTSLCKKIRGNTKLPTSIESVYFRDCDERKEKFRKINDDPKTRKKRGQRRLDNINEGWKQDKEAAKQGFLYHSGTATTIDASVNSNTGLGSIESDVTDTQKSNGSKRKVTSSTSVVRSCKCGSTSHANSNSLSCPRNKKRLKTSDISETTGV